MANNCQGARRMIGYLLFSGPLAGRMAAWSARALQERLRVAVSLSLGRASAHPEKGVVMRATIVRHCRYWAIGGIAAGVGLAGLASPAGPAPAGNRKDLENFQHGFVVLMENTGFAHLIGDPNAPWVNQAGRQDQFA